jgi:hypothetical protein
MLLLILAGTSSSPKTLPPKPVNKKAAKPVQQRVKSPTNIM